LSGKQLVKCIPQSVEYIMRMRVEQFDIISIINIIYNYHIFNNVYVLFKPN